MEFDPEYDDHCPYCGHADLIYDVYTDEGDNCWSVIQCSQCKETLWDEKDECLS